MQTTDLELSKRLYEKLKRSGIVVKASNYHTIEGVLKEQGFTFEILGDEGYLGSMTEDGVSYPVGVDEDGCWFIIPAYTLEELVVVLPVEVVSNKSGYVYTHDRYLSLPENEVMNSFGYYHPEKQHWLSVFSDFNPTQSAGKLLEWCLDNGHIGAKR